MKRSVGLKTACVLGTLLIASSFIAMFVPSWGDVPYSNDGMQMTNTPTYAIGNVPNYYKNADAPAYPGVPTTPLVEYYLDAPAAADADWFVNDADATLTTAMTLIDQGVYLGAGWNDINSATAGSSNGLPFIRNFVATPNQSTTGTLQLKILDAQDNIISLTNAWSGSSSAWTTAVAGKRLIEAKATVAFSASTTYDIGTGNEFGLPYPMYANTIQDDFFDTDGTGYPATAVTVNAVAGDPSTSTADNFGTVDFDSDVADGTNDYVLWYISTHHWDPDEAYPSTSWDLR